MKKLLGGILLAIGILIAGASGLCSAVVLISTIGQNTGEDFLLVLLIGGIPFALGVGLLFAGRALIRASGGSD